MLRKPNVTGTITTQQKLNLVYIEHAIKEVVPKRAASFCFEMPDGNQLVKKSIISNKIKPFAF